MSIRTATKSPLSGWLKPALWIPWQDRTGRFSALHGTAFLALLLPGAIIAVRWSLGEYQPRPVNEVVHQTGLWAIRILFVSLAITPLRAMLGMPKLIAVRRMIGVAAFAYVLVHLLLYALDENFHLPKVATEILVRYYLLIGFCALMLLATLAWTSTGPAIRRLGGGHWQNVHRLVYVAAVLAVAHHFMQSKVDVTEPTIMTGLLVWLMLYRLLSRRPTTPPSIGLLLGMALVAALLTVAAEAAYYELFTGIDGMRVLEANLIPPWDQARPAWKVLAILVGSVAGAASWRRLVTRRKPVRSGAAQQ
ncbi:MAG: sulfite oxidase heme-binding subunit YedZ [Reyranellaceae bacterium]